jgi:hypothetical protein
VKRNERERERGGRGEMKGIKAGKLWSSKQAQSLKFSWMIFRSRTFFRCRNIWIAHFFFCLFNMPFFFSLNTAKHLLILARRRSLYILRCVRLARPSLM